MEKKLIVDTELKEIRDGRLTYRIMDSDRKWYSTLDPGTFQGITFQEIVDRIQERKPPYVELEYHTITKSNPRNGKVTTFNNLHSVRGASEKTERLTDEESLRDRIDRLHANLNGEWTPSAIEIVVEKETEVLRRERDELRKRVERLEKDNLGNMMVGGS